MGEQELRLTTDTDAIRAEIARLKLLKNVVARKLHITPSSLANKLNGKTEFTSIEIATIAKLTNKPIEFYIKLVEE